MMYKSCCYTICRLVLMSAAALCCQCVCRPVTRKRAINCFEGPKTYAYTHTYTAHSQTAPSRKHTANTEHYLAHAGNSGLNAHKRHHRALRTATTGRHTETGGARRALPQRAALACTGPSEPPPSRARALNSPSRRRWPTRSRSPKRCRRRRQRHLRRPQSRREAARVARRAGRGRCRAMPLRSLLKQPLRGCARAQSSERCDEPKRCSRRTRRRCSHPMAAPSCVMSSMMIDQPPVRRRASSCEHNGQERP